MRLNFEDAELGSYKIRKLATTIKKMSIPQDTECQAIGYLVRIWHNAINDQKQEISIEDIDNYLMIFDLEKTQQIVDALVEAEYLNPTDEKKFFIVGKEKDFAAREIFQKNAQRLNKYKKSSSKKQEKSKTCDAKKDLTSPVRESYESRTRVERDSHESHTSLGCNTIQIQYNTNTIQNTNTIAEESEITDSKEIIPAKKDSQVIKENYFNFYHEKYGFYPSKWGAAENAQAARLARDAEFGVERTCELLKMFIAWQDLVVVREKHPFTKGFGSFVYNLDKLRAEISHPEMLAQAKAATAIFEKTAQLIAKGAERDASDAAQKARVLKILNGGMSDYGSACN